MGMFSMRQLFASSFPVHFFKIICCPTDSDCT
ncbi:MAG: hypothetical protein ACI9P8_001550, partial [Bacteroidia bacterium]